MTAEETAATGQLVRQLAADRSLSVIIIEHDINFIRDLKAPITVLHLGRVLREGTFDEIAETPQVREVYLGTAESCLRSTSVTAGYGNIAVLSRYLA